MDKYHKLQRKGFLREFAFLLILFISGSQIIAQDRTLPGKVITPYPTIINLAIEWNIQGDDNQNGTVSVQFREKGKTEWQRGMPLRRVPAGKRMPLPRLSFLKLEELTWENKHSGSIFDLQPDTEYEIKLNLEDPDGGFAEKTVKARTRPVPVFGNKAQIIDVKPGNYDTLHTKDGRPNRPLVYCCSNGKASFTHIDLQDRKWVFIEGLTVNNKEDKGIGISLNGAENCVVRHCTVNAVYGIVAYWPGASNCYISDNIVTGICDWTYEAMGASGKNIGEGIEMTGGGNVICYNRVSGFRDCISTMEDQHVVNQVCIDIYNNDIYTGADDGIEADFCLSNCRIFRNRLTNCCVGLSSQPGLGGPNYFIRNVMYNMVHAAFKLKRFSQGDVVFHNTVIKVGTGLGGNDTMDYAYFRNNLAIGGPADEEKWFKFSTGKPYAADIIAPGDHSDFDYDAVGVYESPYEARIGGIPFSVVEEHGIERIQLEATFNDVEFPYPPVPERKVPDLRPKPGFKGEDAALHIPNVNDDYTGKAPDCGAYEVGQELPHYGPRLFMSNEHNK